jgi:hypothetical protein
MSPHIPEFPPVWRDWAPGNPFEIEPPLPRFMWNPLTPEQIAELEREYGRWAARRTLAMLSPAETFETAKAYARSMYESMKARALAGLPPLPPTRPRRERKPREEVAKEIEELREVIAPKELTPELEADLTARVLTTIHRAKRPLNIEFQQTLARSVIAWADAEGVKLSEEEAARIVKSAIATLKPEVAVRTKEGEIIRWETAEGIALPPEMWPAKT